MTADRVYGDFNGILIEEAPHFIEGTTEESKVVGFQVNYDPKLYNQKIYVSQAEFERLEKSGVYCTNDC